MSTKTGKLVFGIMLLCSIMFATENAFAQESDLNSILENALSGGGGAKKKGGAKRGGGGGGGANKALTADVEALKNALAEIREATAKDLKKEVDDYIEKKLSFQLTVFYIINSVFLFFLLGVAIAAIRAVIKTPVVRALSSKLQAEIQARQSLQNAHTQLKNDHDALKRDHDTLSNRVP